MRILASDVKISGLGAILLISCCCISSSSATETGRIRHKPQEQIGQTDIDGEKKSDDVPQTADVDIKSGTRASKQFYQFQPRAGLRTNQPEPASSYYYNSANPIPAGQSPYARHAAGQQQPAPLAAADVKQPQPQAFSGANAATFGFQGNQQAAFIAPEAKQPQPQPVASGTLVNRNYPEQQAAFSAPAPSTLFQAPQQVQPEAASSPFASSPLIQLLVPNSLPFSDAPVEAAVAPLPADSQLASSALDPGTTAFIVIPENLQEYLTLTELSKRTSYRASLPQQVAAFQNAPAISYDLSALPGFQSTSANMLSLLSRPNALTGSPTAASGFRTSNENGNNNGAVQARNTFSQTTAPQESRTFLSGFSLASATGVSSFLPVTAVATIVDGANTATATSVSGLVILNQANAFLTTKVVGIILGLDSTATYNVEIFSSGDVSGGSCANTGTLFTTGGLTGVVAASQTPVGGSLSIFNLFVPLTAMTLHGTNTAAAKSVVIRNTATGTLVGCGTITAL